MIRSRGKPLASLATWHMASMGFAKMTITAFGEALAAAETLARTMAALPFSSSSRVIPGLRGAPAVQITTSESAVSSQPSVAVMRVLKPSQAAAWDSSSALPKCMVPANWGSSWRTTSQISRSMRRWAIAPPVAPAPMIVTFLRAIRTPWLCSCGFREITTRPGYVRRPRSAPGRVAHLANEVSSHDVPG